MTDIFVQNLAITILVETHFDMRLRKRQHGVKNAGPKRYMEHNLYPVFLPDLKHANKSNTPVLA